MHRITHGMSAMTCHFGGSVFVAQLVSWTIRRSVRVLQDIIPEIGCVAECFSNFHNFDHLWREKSKVFRNDCIDSDAERNAPDEQVSMVLVCSRTSKYTKQLPLTGITSLLPRLQQLELQPTFFLYALLSLPAFPQSKQPLVHPIYRPSSPHNRIQSWLWHDLPSFPWGFVFESPVGPFGLLVRLMRNRGYLQT